MKLKLIKDYKMPGGVVKPKGMIMEFFKHKGLELIENGYAIDPDKEVKEEPKKIVLTDKKNKI